MPTQAEIDDYRLINRQLSDAGGIAAVQLIEIIGAGASREQVIAAYPDTIYPYINASQVVSAQWYEDLDPSSSYRVDLDDLEPVNLDSLHANMGWALNQNNPVEAIRRSANRQVRNGGRGVIESNARRENVTFARQAQPDACGFCKLLATRGAVYFSKRSAGGYTDDSYHDGCMCVVVPSRAGSPYVEPDYIKDWNAEYAAVSKNVTPKEGQSTILAYSDAMQPRGPGTAYPGQ